MRFLLCSLLLIALVFSSTQLCVELRGEVPDQSRPNIVVLICDDLGYGDLGCYGHPHIKTPNLDQLAAGGVRLTACYSAAPVCSPSRVGLMTGRSPNRAGVYDWIPPAGKPRPDARDLVHLRSNETTIATLLDQAGYQTAMAGKWHCNSRFNSPKQPQPGDHGFQHWLATQNNASPSHENPTNFVRNGKPVGPVDGFACQYVVDESIAWLKETDADRPFFLYVPFHEPHEPVASPEDLVAQYREVAINEDQAQYFANVANVDAAVGRLIDALDASGRRDNTMIIFTSDNGPETLNRYRSANRSHGTPGPLRGMKLHTTEAGFRVAGIVNFPARLKAGQTINTAVSSLDFLPTFCKLAQCELPDRELDGIDCMPILTGQSTPRDRPLVWAYYNAINDARVAMRDGKYKVLAKLNGGKVAKMQNVTPENLPIVRDAKLTDLEVYDVTTDIGETNNLAATDAALSKALQSKLTSAYQNLLDDSHAWVRP